MENNIHISRFFYLPALSWFFIALAVRIFVMLLIHLYSLESGFEGFYPLASGHDDVAYWAISDSIQNGEVFDDVPNFYPFILAILFSVTTRDLLIGKFLNVIADASTVYFGVLITHELLNNINKFQRDLEFSVKYTGLLLTFYPSGLFYSTQLLKDPLLVLFGILNLYLSILIFKRPKAYLLILWTFSLLGVYVFRSYAAIGLLLSLILYILFMWNVKKSKKIVAFILIIIVCSLVAYVLGQGIFSIERILPLINTEEIARQREFAYSTGGSSTCVVIGYNNPFVFMYTYGLSCLTVMFGPFPWQLNSLVQIIALPETILMWVICYHLLRSQFSKINQPKTKKETLLLIFSLVLIGIVAFFSDNIGANTRLRVLPWISFVIYTSIRFYRQRLLRVNPI